MRVFELLKDPQFSDLELLAGKSGDHNLISAVTVVDTPDGALWLNGGELVITTGFALGDDEKKLLDFLDVLAQHKAAALGIKRNRHISTIYPSALNMANQLNLPLVMIPESYAFADLITPILSRIIDRQHMELTQNSIIHKKFLELAVNDRPVGEILQVLSLIVGIPAAFVDVYFHETHFSDPESPLAQELSTICPSQVTDEILEQYDHYTVTNQSSTFGYMLFPKNSLEKSSNSSAHVAVEQAAITLILRMQVRLSNKYVEERYRATFVEDLLFNNIKGEQEIHNRAHLYGWDLHDGGIVAVVDVNNLKKHFTQKLDSSKNQMLENMVGDIFDLSIREVKHMFTSAIYMRQSDLIAFLITVPPAERRGLCDKLQQVFQRIQGQLSSMTTFTISLGVGCYYENIRDIYRSYSEARTAINLSYALRSFDCILFYEKLGLYRILTPVMNTPETLEYCEKYLEPLEQYDQANGQDLVNTLHEIIMTGWNLKKAANNLYLHYNSMKYRYSRICSIMNLDLNDPNNRTFISIALIVHMMNRSQVPEIKAFSPPLNNPLPPFAAGHTDYRNIHGLYTGAFQCRGTRLHRAAGGIDIIDQQHTPKAFILFCYRECTGQITQTGGGGQLLLRQRIFSSAEQLRLHRDMQAIAQMPCEKLSLIEPAFSQACRMNRNRDNGIHIHAADDIFVTDRHGSTEKRHVFSLIMVFDPDHRVSSRFVVV